MKETFYFPHDTNATQDPKMMSLLSGCGLSGLAMYWIIIEILHQQDDGKITTEAFKNYIKLYSAFDSTRGEQVLNTIEQVLITSELLYEQDNFIFSERVLKNKIERKNISELRSQAGKKSAEVRANSTSVEQNRTHVEQGKESKVKESKVKEIEETPPPKKEIKKGFITPSEGLEILTQLQVKFPELNVSREYDKFKSYWTETNSKGKERWECEKFFDVSRRLSTWFSRVNEGGFKKQSGGIAVYQPPV